jgi:ADP-ribosylglycohydrolase
VLSVLSLEVVPLVIPVGELTQSESVSGGALDITIDISQALDESLPEIQAQYFRDSDMGDEVEQVLVEEREYLQEDLQRREEFNKNRRRECEQELHSYYEDDTF